MKDNKYKWLDNLHLLERAEETSNRKDAIKYLHFIYPAFIKEVYEELDVENKTRVENLVDRLDKTFVSNQVAEMMIINNKFIAS